MAIQKPGQGASVDSLKALGAAFTWCNTPPRYLWVGWVALGWGTGVGFHGLRVFDKIPFLNGEWERRQVEKCPERGL